MFFVRNVIFVFTLTTLTLGLLGCSSRGVAEFQLYSQAFDAQIVEGERILDAVAAAERKLTFRKFDRLQLNSPFVPNDAAYYVDGIDPPLTASVRGSLKSLQAYNAALSALANGESAAAVANRIGTISRNVTGAVSALAAASAGGVPGVSPADFVDPLTEALGPLASPFATQLLAITARTSFRQRLLKSYSDMRNMLQILRDKGTPVMFFVLERSYVTPGQDTPTGLTTEGAKKLKADRKTFSGWVLLIDQTLVTMDAAAAAAARQMSATDLAALSETAMELRMLAEKVKTLRP